jgi:hypothetical protein
LPDIGDPFDVATSAHVDASTEENAFELYRSAAERMTRLSPAFTSWHVNVMERGWGAAKNEMQDVLPANGEALDLFRRASERREAVHYQPAESSLLADHAILEKIRDLARLAQTEAARLEAEGDVAAAWGWHCAVLRSSRHLGLHGGMLERVHGIALHTHATNFIVRWTGHHNVDAKMLRAALEDVKAIDRTTVPPSGPLKVEYFTFLNMIDNPNTIDFQRDAHTAVPNRVTWWMLYCLGEPEMSLRVVRLVWANWLSQWDQPRYLRPQPATIDHALFAIDPARPPAGSRLPPDDIENWLEKKTVLAKTFTRPLMPFLTIHDRERAREMLIEANFALQLYYREHGAFPESADALVEGTQEKLPVDVFGTGGPIHYRRESDPADGVTIWSIGPDGVDDDGRLDATNARNNTGRVTEQRPSFNSAIRLA